MSSLIPERQLTLSPSLAATIGLEEALLLPLLNDATHFGQAKAEGRYQWLELEPQKLQALLPFWDEAGIRRICQSLADKGVILLRATAAGQRLHFAMNEQTGQQPTTQQPAPAAISRPASNRSRQAGQLPEHWQPEEDLLQLLALNHNIPRDFALQQCEDFILYWRERGQVSHAWSSKFRQHVLKEWRHHQSRQAASEQAAVTTEPLAGGWQPSLDALEILQRAEINRDFIDDAIPEFVLYWRERGEASTTWNSKFIAHIRRQWAKFNQTLVLDYEPRPIPADWQPSEDVYDILRMATIDISFARQLVAEFVLFWRDTKQIQRSWNTKFLQHTKYQWASRHQLGQKHEGQPVSHQSGKAADGSLIKRLNDRSWAEGLVEDS